MKNLWRIGLLKLLLLLLLLLFYKCTRKLNQGLPETNSVSGQNAVLNPGSLDLKAHDTSVTK